MNAWMERAVLWLDSVVPEPFEVRSINSGLVRIATAGNAASVTVDIAGILGNDVTLGAIEIALHALLASAQDHISRNLREPWPSRNGELAMPCVASTDAGFEVGYAVDGQWVLRLPTAVE